MRARTWAAVGGAAVLASVAGWLLSRPAGLPQVPPALPAETTTPGEPPGATVDQSRAAAARRAADGLTDAVANGLQVAPEVEVHDAGIDFSVATAILQEARWRDAGARVIGQRCEPPPCVVGFAMPSDPAQRRELQNELNLAMMEAGRDVAAPTMAWTDTEAGDRLGFAWYVPHDIGAEESNAMQAQAADHVLVLGGSR